MNPKSSLRKSILAKRNQLSPSFQTQAGQKIQKYLLSREEIQNFKTISLYWSFRCEVPTEKFFTTLRELKKKVCFPRINPKKNQLEFFQVESASQMIPGPYKNKEPRPELPQILLNQIETMILPAVALDLKGNRLGLGKGFYDKALHSFLGTRIALAYDFQVVDQVPTEDFDEAVDVIITESQIIKCALVYSS